MRQLSWLLLCWWSLVGCASDSAGEGMRHAQGAEDSEAPAIFLPVELLEWGGWSDEALEKMDRSIYFVKVESVGEVVEVGARRPPRRGGRSGLGGRSSIPLLNPRPSRDEIAGRRRQAEEYRIVKVAQEQYFQALREAQARYPNHHGYQDHHFIPIYLGGQRNGVTYRLHFAYHQAITQEFRRLWPYGQKGPPSPELIQRIILEVYSKYPIPQLIGITP